MEGIFKSLPPIKDVKKQFLQQFCSTQKAHFKIEDPAAPGSANGFQNASHSCLSSHRQKWCLLSRLLSCQNARKYGLRLHFQLILGTSKNFGRTPPTLVIWSLILVFCARSIPFAFDPSVILYLNCLFTSTEIGSYSSFSHCCCRSQSFCCQALSHIE